jgi:CRP-like cAMP-binding protein
VIASPERSRVCPDCPAKRARILEQLVEQPSGCAFRCLSIAAREPLPLSWRREYGLALVRRGIVVRQRLDAQGRATAIDVVGPGGAFPITDEGDGTTGYAVDDAMLCLCPSPVLDATVDGGSKGARAVVRAQAAVLTRVERIAEARGRASAEARIAALLVTIADTLCDRPLTSVPAAIQQRDLAALVAMRHESVCRVIAALSKRVVIERTPQGLRIADRAALEAA